VLLVSYFLNEVLAAIAETSSLINVYNIKVSHNYIVSNDKLLNELNTNRFIEYSSNVVRET